MYITYQDKDVIDSIRFEKHYEPPKPVLPEPQPDEELNFSPEPDLRGSHEVLHSKTNPNNNTSDYASISTQLGTSGIPETNPRFVLLEGQLSYTPGPLHTHLSTLREKLMTTLELLQSSTRNSLWIQPQYEVSSS